MPVFGNPTQYAQPTDLANLGLIGGVLSSISTNVQNAALLAASGLADAKLQSRYILPLAQWGQDLVRAVCIIAAYDLLTSKGYNPATGADPNIRERYLDQLKWLDSVSRGEDTPSYVVDSSQGGSSGTTGSSPAPDGSIVTTSEGGLQMQTSNVRGFTRRGDDQTQSPLAGEFWDSGTGNL